MVVTAASSGEGGAAGRPVRLDVDPATRVGTIVLDRPPLNALDLATWRELAVVVAEAGRRDDVGALIVRGGSRAFATGADVEELAGRDDAAAAEASKLMQGALSALAELPAVSIAVITGYALGAGCELALACDLRIAADNAKVGQPEVLLGGMPGAGGTQRLARLVGAGRAKDLLLTGRMVDMVEAPSIGLVDRVLPADEVLSAAEHLAATLAAGPAAGSRIKRAVDEGLRLPLADGLALERELFAGTFMTDDLRTGVASFLADGPGVARFTGR